MPCRLSVQILRDSVENMQNRGELETVQIELRKLESAYKLWLSAFIDLHPGQPSLAVVEIKKQAQKILGLAKTAGVPDEVTPSADAIMKWVSRASLPRSEITRDALAKAVMLAVPTPPAGITASATFNEIVNKIDHLRASLREREVGFADDESLYQSGILRFPVVTASDLDSRELGLGSFLFGGESPPYVKRTIHAEIEKALAAQLENVILIEGSVKSGKTRLMVEALKSSRINSYKVYWLSNLDGSIGSFLKKIGSKSGRRRIIVLDDLQSFRLSLHPFDLNLSTLRELSRIGVVVATNVIVDSLERRQTTSANRYHSGPELLYQSREVVTSFRVEATLDESELLRSQSVLQGLKSESGAEKLASFLASGEVLLDRFLSMRGQSSIVESICDSTLICNLLFPSGFKIAVLKEIALRKLTSEAPHAMWSDLLFEDTVFKLTAGVGPGSPHSILTLPDKAAGDYKLFDYIWSELDLSGISLPPLSGLDVDLNRATNSARLIQNWPVAEELNQRRLAEDPNDDIALAQSADIHLVHSRLEEAKAAAERAIVQNPSDWRHYFFLSLAFQRGGELEAAANTLRRGLSVLPNNYELSVELAPLLVELGRANDALELIESVPQSSFPSQLDYLVAMTSAYWHCGDFDKSKKFAQKGLRAQPDNCILSSNFGWAIGRSDGTQLHLVELEAHLELCEKPCLSNRDYIHLLIATRQLDRAEAELHKRPAWMREYGFSSHLGELASLKGDNEKARQHLELAVDNQGFEADFAKLSSVLIDLGDKEASRKICGLGLIRYPQSSDLLNQMAISCEPDELGDSSDWDESSGWFEKATLTRNPNYHPFFNLARIKARAKELEAALALYEKGVELGGVLQDYDREALAFVHWELGNYDSCAEYSRLRFESEHSSAALEDLLSCLTAEQRLTYLESLPKHLSDYFWVQLMIVDNLKKLGDHGLGRARSLASRIQRANPKNLEVAFQLGRLAQEMGDTSSALKWFSHCDELQDEEYVASLASMYLAATRASLVHAKGQILDLEGLREKFSGSESEFFYYLAWANIEAKNFDVAEEVIERGLKLDKDDTRLLNTQAALLLRMSDRRQDAITLIKKSLELDSSRDNAAAAIRLLEEMIDVGRYGEAREIARSYLDKAGIGLPPQADLDLTRLLERLDNLEAKTRRPQKSMADSAHTSLMRGSKVKLAADNRFPTIELGQSLPKGISAQ
jgi:tetratricopeptide (TPR) repeat protein